MSVKVKYISFGRYHTGGYYHELFFANSLVDFLNKGSKTASLAIIRKDKFYSNLFDYLKLIFLGVKANANYNVVVSRIALAAILANLFTKNKIYIVLHNYDEDDNKSKWLKLYYQILFFTLRTNFNKNVSIIAVSNYWVNFFKRVTKNKVPVNLFPNFFDNDYYKKIYAYFFVK